MSAPDQASVWGDDNGVLEGIYVCLREDGLKVTKSRFDYRTEENRAVSRCHLNRWQARSWDKPALLLHYLLLLQGRVLKSGPYVATRKSPHCAAGPP